jgi:prepilin-type N-terminal cleavage/methylation domain-containing protein
MTKQRLTVRRAFTLIELLVVIAIMAIMMAATLPMIPAVNDQARVATCQSRQEQIGMALRLYAEDHHRYPARLQELVDQRYLDSANLLRCDKTGAEFHYHPVPLSAAPAELLLACCDPKTESGKRPHRHGLGIVELHRSGPAGLATQ